MVAAFILAIALLGLARLQGAVFTANAESRMRSHALNLAQKKLEELRAFANQTKYMEIGNGDRFDSSDTDGCVLDNGNSCCVLEHELTSLKCVGENSNFTRTWTQTACANSAPCKVLAVTVTWTDQKGNTQTVTLTSYIADIDPVKGGVALLGL